MTMKRSAGILVTLIVGSLLGCAALFAQAGSATVSGTVHDPSGAIVPNATVTITNTATGVAHSTVTTSGGLYVLPNLAPGNYRLNINASGFQPKDVTGITLDVDQQATVNVDVAVGSSSQSVAVSASALLLQTEEASVGTVVQTQQVQSLPLN